MTDVPVHLLAPPADLPRVDRTTAPDGTVSMTGKNAQESFTDIYGVCGAIRGGLVALQDAVRTAQSKPLKEAK